MFPISTYQSRRQRLLDSLPNSGLIILLGNIASPRNFPHNTYPFRQDSTFSYFFGLDQPGLAAIIDTDTGEQTLFGDGASVDDLVWTGLLPEFSETAASCGISETRRSADFPAALSGKRPILSLPVYQPGNSARLPQGTQASEALIRAVVAQRAYKSEEEIAEIEIALDVSHAVHTAAMRLTAPGRREYEIVAEVEGICHAMGAANSFATIFSRNGEILHNPYHHNVLDDGDIVVHDSGAESPLHYASDITRTIPVNGKFDSRQRDIYSIVLDSQQAAIDALAPGRPFRDLHAISGRVIIAGLKAMGIFKGDVDEALAADVHTLVFPCGLGHMMGLDVHDMEGIGEEFVGYDESIQRNPAFGWRSLRLGRKLEPDWVVTVEPGIYFNGLLADRWRADGTCTEFIDFGAFDLWRDFGGVRLEDDFLITPDGHRLLGEPIPKTIDEVETACVSGV